MLCDVLVYVILLYAVHNTVPQHVACPVYGLPSLCANEWPWSARNAVSGIVWPSSSSRRMSLCVAWRQTIELSANCSDSLRQPLSSHTHILRYMLHMEIHVMCVTSGAGPSRHLLDFYISSVLNRNVSVRHVLVASRAPHQSFLYAVR